jgi:hypothetical protein
VRARRPVPGRPGVTRGGAAPLRHAGTDPSVLVCASGADGAAGECLDGVLSFQMAMRKRSLLRGLPGLSASGPHSHRIVQAGTGITNKGRGNVRLQVNLVLTVARDPGAVSGVADRQDRRKASADRIQRSPPSSLIQSPPVVETRRPGDCRFSSTASPWR